MTTSQITVDLITIGLDAVDPMVQKHLTAPYDSEQIQNLAKRLGTDVVNYDNYRAAGRLLMYNAIRACSTDIRRYVKALDHRLNKSCKQFMIDHADAINTAISERRHLDYTQHDLMSASSLINIYLLTPAHEEDPAETPQQHHMRQAVQFYHKVGIHRVLQAYREMSDEEYTHASPTRFNAGTVKAQMGSCFIAGTEVCTLLGVKKIEDVVIGDQVISHTGVIQTVVQLHTNPLGNRKLYDVLCWKTPTITVTDNHRVYAITRSDYRPQWIRIDQLTTGHYVAVPKKEEWTMDPALDLADVLKHVQRGDHVEYSFEITEDTITTKSITTMMNGMSLHGDEVSRCHEHKSINRFLRFTSNTSMALGMWYGDGCIRSKKDQKEGVSHPSGICLVSHESNPRLVNFWAEAMEELVAVKSLVYKQGNLYNIEVRSAIIGACWKNLFGKGFDGKRLHPSMFDWSPELVRGFMIGLMSTDGCMSKDGKMSVSLTNVDLIKQIYHLCRQIGEDVTITINKQIKIGATALTATLTLPRGWIQPNELIKYYNDDRLEQKHQRSTTHHTIRFNDRSFVRVRYTGESRLERPEYVYTLGIENDHSYNVEGLVVENCFLETIGDNLESILYQGVGDSGMISKDNGGLGLNLQYIRHSEIAYSGKSSGLIPFARVYNATIKSVNQGGKRDGAATLFARDFHIDVEALIKSTDNFTNHELRLTDANTCLWMSRLFFKRVAAGGKWTIFCPARASELNELYGYELEEAYCRLEAEAVTVDQQYQMLVSRVNVLKNELLTDPEDEGLRDKYERTLHEKLEAKKKLITHKAVDANELYTLIVTTQVRSSMPYIMHGDAVNYKCNQKNLGPVGSSNLCVAPETPILTSKGYYQISDLKDQQVDVWNGDAWSSVKVVQTGQQKPIISIVLSNGLWLECTPQHKFLIAGGCYATMQKRNYKGCIRLEARELKAGDSLVKFETPVIQGDEKYDVKYPYTHGFYCGDGTDHPRVKNGRYTSETSYIIGEKISPHGPPIYYRSKVTPNKTSASIALYGQKKLLINYLEARSYTGVEDSSGRLNLMLHDDIDPKFVVPFNASLRCRLDWFAGLMDADGTVAWNETNASIQWTSVEFEFMYRVQLMLQTLGVQSAVSNITGACISMLPDAMGGSLEYKCRPRWRLLISSYYTQWLLRLGWNPKRLNFDGMTVPKRSASKFITVMDIVDRNRVDDTYCFTEPLNNTGVFNGILTGQCLEVTERSTPDEIASCNLASMNLRYYVQGVIPWRAALVSYAELQVAYDFKGLGRSIGSVVENLDEVIEQNDYPLDERDPVTNAIIKRGKISITNLRNRPLGIGVSGLFDACVETDQCYDSSGVELLNKMIFACMYWNALVKSMEMAIRLGPYETFRTGTYKRYLGQGRWQQCFGSPLSNGQFQFDLWQEDAQLLSDNGDLDEEIYNRDDDLPLSPTTWGQEATRIKCPDYKGNHVDITVQPSWDSLRPLIMRYGVRHSLLIALMPTASSAQAIRNTESTEGHQAVLYTRSVIHGNFTIVVPQLIKDLKEIGVWTEKLADFIMVCEGSVKYIHHYIADKPEDFPEANFVTDEHGRQVLPKDILERLRYVQKKYQTMYELSQKITIRHARQRGIYVCQSQSLNIYAQDATEQQLKAIHSYTNKMGLKTGMYYLRQNPAKFTGQFTIDPLMLKYTQTLLQRMNIPKHVRASSVQNAITNQEVCEMKPGCISCN